MAGFSGFPTPDYDAFILSGDPHMGTAEAQCENTECPDYAKKREVDAHIEYGVVDDYDEQCPVCLEFTLISWGERLPELDEETKEMEVAV